MMPLTTEQFLKVFADYNQTVFPMQFFLIAAALLIVFLAFNPGKSSSKLITAILAFFWLWMGAVYHLIFFSQINPLAFLFGGLFVLQAVILFYAGVLTNKLSFRFYYDAKGVTGFLLILYALFFYPLLGLNFEHQYPQLPTFGLPCPTTIFTFGLFLWTDKKMPFSVWLIPFIWSLIGSSAVFLFGIREDFGLLLAGIIGTTILLWNNRQSFNFAR